VRYQMNNSAFLGPRYDNNGALLTLLCHDPCGSAVRVVWFYWRLMCALKNSWAILSGASHSLVLHGEWRDCIVCIMLGHLPFVGLGCVTW